MVTPLRTALDKLHRHIYEMGMLVHSQLGKAGEALLNYQVDLAYEVTSVERHVDSMDLRNDETCEEILALYSPVASDLRFVLASLRINLFLERIGDHAASIAQYTIQLEKPLPEPLIKVLQVKEAFQLATDMLLRAMQGYMEESDTDVRQIFQMDHKLNQIVRTAPERLAKQIQQECQEWLVPGLFLFSVLRKLERVGDLSKNIGEEVVFYLRAKMIRHYVKLRSA